jgi:ABC-type transport system substrate-binding protein
MRKIFHRDALDRRSLLKAAVAVVGAPLAALSVFPAVAQGQRRGGVLKIAQARNPSTLDPVTGFARFDMTYVDTLFDTLVEWDTDTLEARPGLASSWEFVNPKKLVMKLRQGVKFHNGEVFDANAAKFNLDRARSDARSNYKADLEVVEGVEVSGPFEIVLNLKNVSIALPLVLSDRAGTMSSPRAVRELGKDHDRNPVGTGPWKFVSWANDERIVVARNPDYWKPKLPYLDGIEFTIIKDVQIGLKSVLSGGNDLVFELLPMHKAQADRAPGIVSNVAPSQTCYGLYLNYGRPALKDLRVRRALNLALDRQGFSRAALGGIGEVAHTLIPKAHWAYAPDLANFYAYDPDKAKALLREAGHGDGIEISMVTPATPANQQRNEIVMEMWRKVGINIKMRTGTATEAANQYFLERNYDMYFSTAPGRPDPWATYASYFAEGAYINASREAEPAFSKLLADAGATSGVVARKASMAKVQRYVAENELFVPIAFDVGVAVFSDKVKGFKGNLLSRPKFATVSMA